MIPNCIEAKRKERGMNQAALARALHVDRATVLRWERGEVDIPYETLKNIARFFHVAPADLLPEMTTVLTPEEPTADEPVTHA